MIFNMLFCIHMYMMFIFMVMMSMSFYYLDLLIILEWLVFEFNSMNIKFVLLIDWISLSFISFIMLISSMVMLYSMIYMEGDKYMSRFNYLLLLFIFSMVLMVMSPNVVSILIGWDGLGVVSYCLVMYYHNYSSYNSSMVTVLCNRIGDVGILMAIGLMMVMGSWDLLMVKGSNMLMFLLMLAAITKSAQVPFSVWLPLAMAAPTPVSALVHSSTLVTAGVYLMIRFNSVLMETSVSLILSMVSIITMFMSGLMANFENDFKKIIALSTLSQLGMMMMILSFGHSMMAYYHLLVHAIFKSMLFMAAGVVIHLMNNIQDIRLLGNLNELIPYVMMSLMISNFALGGVPFMSGFYSKDLMMEVLYIQGGINLLMFILVVMSLLMTVSYSVRFFYYLFFNSSMKFYSYIYIKENSLMNISMIMMMCLSIILGSLMDWIYYFDSYMIYLSLFDKLITLGCCLLGVALMMVVFILSKFMWMYYCFYFFSSMWFLISLYSWIYNPLNEVSSMLGEVDQSWAEFMGKNLFKSFIGIQINNNYKLYMFMFAMIYFIVLVYMMVN